MKNLHLIATNKFSQFIQNNRGILKVNDNFTQSDLDFIQAKFINIYITSYEEIKEGVDQWYLDKVLNEPYNSGSAQYSSKQDIIILTTDQDLIKDGVQPIDDDFLEWFVKNPSCEEVDVFQEKHHAGEVVDESYPKGFFDYKIIIPKEEQKELRRKLFTLIKSLEQEEPKQETLEEFIRKAYLSRLKDCLLVDFEDGVKLGAKWQAERRYSEEEVLSILTQFENDEPFITKEWFEQFKKK